MNRLVVATMALLIVGCISPPPEIGLSFEYDDNGKASDSITLDFCSSLGAVVGDVTEDTLWSGIENAYIVFLNEPLRYEGDTLFPRIKINNSGNSVSITLLPVVLENNVNCDVVAYRFWTENRGAYLGKDYIHYDIPDSVEGLNGKDDSLAVSVSCDR